MTHLRVCQICRNYMPQTNANIKVDPIYYPDPNRSPEAPHGPSLYEEYVALGIEAREKKELAQWEVGRYAWELTGHLERSELYGNNLLAKYARDTGWDVKTLERYRRVYRAYHIDRDPKDTENLYVSFTHFERAARTDDPVAWLERAQDDNLTVQELDRQIRGVKADRKKEWVIECPSCGHEIHIDKS